MTIVAPTAPANAHDAVRETLSDLLPSDPSDLLYNPRMMLPAVMA